MKTIGEAIGKFLKESGLDQKLLEHKVMMFWDEILAGKIASNTNFIRVKDGVIAVGMRSAVARRELTMRKREVMRSINEKLGHDYIKDIRIS
jgi:predicted nucleic acid-binding Zn ribbon protein